METRIRILKRSHYLALEMQREYEKKCSEMQIKFAKERSNLSQQADNESSNSTRDEKTTTKLRDF